MSIGATTDNFSQLLVREPSWAPLKPCSDGLSIYHFKILIPASATGAIIGKAGSTIAQLQSNSGARVRISKATQLYPGTNERVCLISGTVDAIIRIHDFIMYKIRESLSQQQLAYNRYTNITSTASTTIAGVTTNPVDPYFSHDHHHHQHQQPQQTHQQQHQQQYFDASISSLNTVSSLDSSISSSTSSSSSSPVPGSLVSLSRRDKQVKILVPNSTAGMIIGKGGQHILQMKRESGAYIQISQKSLDVALPERCITVVGNLESNKKACELILAKIVEDPGSGAHLNINYSDMNGPVANYDPTGSPYAKSTYVPKASKPIEPVVYIMSLF